MISLILLFTCMIVYNYPIGHDSHSSMTKNG
jgi:hypothetical protein